jgi:conjugative transfer signal peptidase TraF
VVGLMLAGLGLMGASIAVTPHVLWNASASLPVGAYWLEPAASAAADRKAPRVGDCVATDLPRDMAALADERGYLPRGVPALKQVGAVAGQQVCRTGDTIAIDGVSVAVAQATDARGRALPVWQGCQRLSATEVFLLNPAPGSFDGRYLGPTPQALIRGRVRPLVSSEAHPCAR